MGTILEKASWLGPLVTKAANFNASSTLSLALGTTRFMTLTLIRPELPVNWEPTPIENGYVIFSAAGDAVAGGGPLIHDGQTPAWCTYMKVADADGSAELAADHGASVLVKPFDVPGQGRVGVLVDPGGAELWIWQSLGFEGADLVGEPGAICRQELVTNDPEAARGFYAAAFGAAAAHFAEQLRQVAAGPEALLEIFRVLQRRLGLAQLADDDDPRHEGEDHQNQQHALHGQAGIHDQVENIESAVHWLGALRIGKGGQEEDSGNRSAGIGTARMRRVSTQATRTPARP